MNKKTLFVIASSILIAGVSIKFGISYLNRKKRIKRKISHIKNHLKRIEDKITSLKEQKDYGEDRIVDEAMEYMSEI